MKRVVFFLILVFSQNLLLSETFWEKTSFPDTISVSLLLVSPKGVIYAVTSSNNGTYISKDNGQTWQRLNIDSTVQVISFYFKDSLVFICSN